MPRTLHGQLKALFALLFIALVAYLAGISRPAPLPQPGIGGFYQVMQVFDGDTLSILKDGKRVTIRLIGIDTPEVNTPYTKAECYGAEAAAAAKQLLEGQTVRIETDSTQDTYDIYNRLLAYVYVPANVRPEGIMVNDYLVREGYAREYTFRDPYVHQAEFRADEATAKEAKKGLWSACGTS